MRFVDEDPTPPAIVPVAFNPERRVSPEMPVEIERHGRREVWTICVGRASSPEDGVISDRTPLARAMLGKREGASGSYVVDGRSWTFRVLRVGPFRTEVVSLP